LPSTATFWIYSNCLLLEFIHFKLWKRVFATIPAADMTFLVAAVAVCCCCCFVVVLGVTGVGIFIRAVEWKRNLVAHGDTQEEK